MSKHLWVVRGVTDLDLDCEQDDRTSTESLSEFAAPNVMLGLFPTAEGALDAAWAAMKEDKTYMCDPKGNETSAKNWTQQDDIHETYATRVLHEGDTQRAVICATRLPVK